MAIIPAPGKYSFFEVKGGLEKLLIMRIRESMKIPETVYDEMISRQLKWCKDVKMTIEEAKAHILKTYVDDINGNVSQETIDINRKVMEGYRHGLNRTRS